ncbi:AbrB family transcriptional regulator [Bacillus manliponensis]|uniref:AbrB family transcriptional regulator n=1 Tax=Bacillus manliponensis TaxID=574376 RepID=A0A073JTI7_9BACI|nr:AbrB/MazE/SpoVT family DNA-binding domain-containing protein [Bacillus manliponensis]KEK17547.1 AbrB family transcriptional regulator [Bacillus manliponensis]
MKDTGIVREVDKLGRVVIPVEMRRTLGLSVGTAMEIHAVNGNIVLKKHEKACLVTGKIAKENFVLLDGRMVLSTEGAEVLLDLITKQGEEKGWLNN